MKPSIKALCCCSWKPQTPRDCWLRAAPSWTLFPHREFCLKFGETFIHKQHQAGGAELPLGGAASGTSPQPRERLRSASGLSMAPVTAPPPPSGCRCGTARALPRAGAVPGLREGAVRGPCAAAVSPPVPLGARAAPFPGRPGGPRRYAGGIMAGASGVSPLVCALQRGAQAWRMGHRPPLCRGHFNNPHLQYPTCCAQGDGPGPHNPPGGLRGTRPGRERARGLAASPGRSPRCPPARKVSSLP